MANKLTTEYVRTDSLRPHPDNPRRGDVEGIKRSLKANGQYRPIVVAEGVVLGGAAGEFAALHPPIVGGGWMPA